MYNSLFDRLPEPVIILNTKTRCVVYSNVLARILFAVSDFSFDNIPLEDFIHADRPDELERLLRETSMSGAVSDFLFSITLPNGTELWISANSNMIAESGACEMLLIFHEVSSKDAKNAELVGFGLLNKILSHITDYSKLEDIVNWMLSVTGQFFGLSRAYVFEDNLETGLSSNTYEWCTDGITPQIDMLNAVPLEDIAVWHKTLREQKLIIAKDINVLEPDIYEILAPQKIKSIVVYPLYIEGELSGCVGFDECRTVRDWSSFEVSMLSYITSIIVSVLTQQRNKQSAEVTQNMMRTVLDSIDAPVFVSDLDTRKILFANKFLNEKAGGSAEQRCCYEIMHPGRCEDCAFDALTASGSHEELREVYDEVDDRWYIARHSLMKWVDGRTSHLHIYSDITLRKAEEKRLRQSLDFDNMTGVYSRDYGISYLERLIIESHEAKRIFTVCYIDIDRLKETNDTYGHAEGDRLIKIVVENITKSVRRDDILARVGGDEFILILTACTLKDSTRIIKHIKRRIGTLNEMNTFPYQVDFSFGAVEVVPSGGLTADEIIEQADKAMYKNKSTGR